MKDHSLLTLLAGALLLAASPLPLPAAEVVVDISSFAPRDPNVVLRQIELNVAIKQYEKTLVEVEEDRLRREVSRAEIQLEMKRSQSAVEEGQAKLDLLDLKAKVLEIQVEKLRDQIHSFIAESNREAELYKQAKAEEKSKPKAEPEKPRTDNQ